MERFYDGDQEKLFAEARVINPFRQGPLISRSRSCQSSLVNVCLFPLYFVIYQSLQKLYFTYVYNTA